MAAAATRARAAAYEATADGWRPRFEPPVLRDVMDPVFSAARWEDWHALRARTLLVLAEDSNVDATCVDRMCRTRPDTQRMVITGAGHDLHLERPEEWIAILRRFLAE